MTDLTRDELKAKINMVREDLNNHVDNINMVKHLTEYLEYLEDELRSEEHTSELQSH